jgi:hypothetical protein
MSPAQRIVPPTLFRSGGIAGDYMSAMHALAEYRLLRALQTWKVGFRAHITGFFSAEGEAGAVRAMLKEIWTKAAIASW